MQPLFLIGYMGCGKSTLGRKLAHKLGLNYIDTDALIEERTGAVVADIFRYEGEARFREAERVALDEAIALGDGNIISTGGGLPVWHDNMVRMNAAGHTIFLSRSASQIAHRLTPYGRQKRFRLRGLNDEELLDFMTRDIAARMPFYAQAHCTIDCDALSDGEVLDFMVEHVQHL